MGGNQDDHNNDDGHFEEGGIHAVNGVAKSFLGHGESLFLQFSNVPADLDANRNAFTLVDLDGFLFCLVHNGQFHDMFRYCEKLGPICLDFLKDFLAGRAIFDQRLVFGDALIHFLDSSSIFFLALLDKLRGMGNWQQGYL